jgi:hypothetical protein
MSYVRSNAELEGGGDGRVVNSCFHSLAWIFSFILLLKSRAGKLLVYTWIRAHYLEWKIYIEKEL